MIKIMLKGLSIVGLLGLFARLIQKILKILITVTAFILVYFGLWVPFFYMLFTGGLMIWGGLDLGVASVERNLFQFGLVLSLIAAVVLFIKNNVVTPISRISQTFSEKMESSLAPRKKKKKKPAPRLDPPVYRDRLPAPRPAMRERPAIYRSRRNPELIIHEYRDRFEVFRIIDGRLTLIEIEYIE